jgi:heme/copper-type cytochrome/quinol oxidase subunit 3
MTAAAGSATPINPEAAAARHRETTAVLGMSLFVASWAMLFAALFFAYGVTRARALAWPPADLPSLPLGWPLLATFAIAASSLALSRARRRWPRPIGAQLLTALAGGGVFLAIQIAVWRALFLAGLRPGTGTYASVFYGLTTFHALHVAVGLVGVLVLWLRQLRGGLGNPIPLRLWTIYTHMVGILWLLLFVGVYCL